ncbi:MAG TPA: S41 family peptidase [Chitinophaga sp.]|uniref:S41 family peptidase n=1 Tax=Chitinophaga sp. TaxID=1869181 RepID=UPI002CD8EA9B|nr:S41 family peptidase [Chitinophaga sp.]HVI44830.1 S41 family peptidase [Chitinophaga sp.]
MKYRISSGVLILLIVTGFSRKCYCQQASNADKYHESLMKDSIPEDADLVLACKVWGFLKYYHPAVCIGRYKWDNELFSIIALTAKRKHLNGKDNDLAAYIKGLGHFRKGKEQEEITSGVRMHPDIDWIYNQEALGQELSSLLAGILHAKRSGKKSYYVSKEKGVGSPVFRHEDDYSEMKYPGVSYRILSLFRYWNMIQYFYPYKYLIQDNWDKVLAELIPIFLHASDTHAYEMAVLKMVSRIHDAHGVVEIAALDQQYQQRYFAPAVIEFVDTLPVVTGFLKDGTLQAGDVILEVNGHPVPELITAKRDKVSASNEAVLLRETARSLLSSDNDRLMAIKIARNQAVQMVKVKLLDYKTYVRLKRQYQEHQRPATWKILAGNIGYVNPESLLVKDIPRMIKDLAGTNGIIFDFRCYPSAYVVYKLGNWLHGGKTPFARFAAGSIRSPGLFMDGNTVYVGRKAKEGTYKGKSVVIVNQETQSQAEYTVMALQAGQRSIVAGSTTAGADGNTSDIVLPGGIYTAFSGIGVYYADGQETQRTGIKIDVRCNRTIAGIQRGEDELLHKAIETIRK